MKNREKILVVEDNVKNRILMRYVLEYGGFAVIEAEDGAEGVVAARREKPDLILMDVQMPVMDGLEAVRRIRAAEAEPEFGEKPTPVLALTANAYAEDRDAALAAGMNGLLVKPLDRERLREALQTIHRASAPLAA